MGAMSTVPDAHPARPPVVLYAENDENDALLMHTCWKRAGLTPILRVVESGRAAMDYLSGSGSYADREANPFPVLVLLDLSMPGCSGLEVLAWVRQQPQFATLPVLILSLSYQARDRTDALALGANDYVVKPTGLSGFVETLRSWNERWFSTGEKGAAG
jgi:CheY-like chemotaxis protein